MSHERVLCKCGAVIRQCRCIEGHANTRTSLDERCAACATKAA